MAGGADVLFVGTKKQAQETIEQEATRAGMPYVNNRWLGGTLTNFRTIQRRIDHLSPRNVDGPRRATRACTKKEQPSI